MATSAEFALKHAGVISPAFEPLQAEALLDSLLKHYYRSDDILANEGMQHDVLEHLCRRQIVFERHLIPWVGLRQNFAGKTVVDIGAGTGSSTFAFARTAGRVVGYEIDPGATQVANDRLRLLGAANAAVHHVEPKAMIARLRQDFPDGIDIVAVIAVLEHMTEHERAEFLAEIWLLMRPGNVMVIAETPNRLTYFDYHTAQIPFFHLLSTDVKLRYVNRSPRGLFVEAIQRGAQLERATVEDAICRWGVGLSFHDFELAFGTDQLETVMLADGYEYPTMQWWPPTPEERVLMEYFVDKPVAKPLGFARSVLNLIFVKPEPGDAAVVRLRHNQTYIANMCNAAFLPRRFADRLNSPGTVGA